MGAQPGLATLPELALASMSFPTLLAHGGIPGLIGEVGSVFVALAIFGYFIRRSARREREEEKNRKS
jgi:hypothetical protein